MAAVRLNQHTRIHQQCKKCRIRCRAQARTSVVRDVDFSTKQVSKNRWKIEAAVQVPTEKDFLWKALTDYENLHKFIPGLVENICYERVADGCTLKQVAAQRISFATINVKAVLVCREFKGGLPRELQGSDADFPELRSWSAAEPWDITFRMVDGDFQLFNGVWRMQEMLEEPPRSTLSYNVLVTPPKLLPVALIQKFIEREVKGNLAAVRSHALLLSQFSSNGAPTVSQEQRASGQ